MILRKAAAAIRQNGPNKVGVKTIMAKAGLTPGGFYAHFESKDDLVAEAIAFMFDERRVTFHEAFEGRTTEEGLIQNDTCVTLPRDVPCRFLQRT